jgi:hypothetical protein
MMSRKRKMSDSYNDGRDSKQRKRITNNIFREFLSFYMDTRDWFLIETTQQKLYDGTKSFFRKLKDTTINNGKFYLLRDKI